MEDFLKVVAPPDIFYENIRGIACEFDVESYQDELYDICEIPFHLVSSKAVVKRKAEFLAGRHCANLCLRQWAIEDYVVKAGQNREPLWPSGLVGAISHSNTYAIAIVADASQYMGVGVDVETLVALDTANRLRSQILTQSEDRRYAHKENFDDIFTICFSIKESLFKAAYPRVQKCFDFSAVSVTRIAWSDDSQGSVNFELNDNLCDEYQCGMLLTGKFCKRYDKIITVLEIPMI
ncbi:4'-phosphopantetheinyl transferase family protein [Teredinibacter haidensis]|uniref:4'-phosphopantetheinyl transferase family protein n=1 Tax=Teredinibacter haidensis TaxID=2731755 RepID=UPI000948EF0D|nr:4'-phosphopantetheinyl transferase superfamily protein [Teredinibacter haidensis]